MATGETGFDDVTFDLISLQYHSLKSGHDYGQYVRDAKNAGLNDVESFLNEVMAQDSERARRCHEFWANCRGRLRPGAAQVKDFGATAQPRCRPEPGRRRRPGPRFA